MLSSSITDWSATIINPSLKLHACIFGFNEACGRRKQDQNENIFIFGGSGGGGPNNVYTCKNNKIKKNFFHITLAILYQ
jgi:hypothetical protein